MVLYYFIRVGVGFRLEGWWSGINVGTIRAEFIYWSGAATGSAAKSSIGGFGKIYWGLL